MKFAASAILALVVMGAAAQGQEKPAASPFLKVDRNHSTVGFEVPILAGLSRVSGKFTDFDVNITYDEKDITKSSVNATIRVASIDTGIPDRDKDLRGEGFFQAEKFPTMTFASSSIEKKGQGFVAHGTLTMKGVAKEIELPFKIAGEFQAPDNPRRVIGFHAQMKLNRRDYGMTWEHRAIANFVGDDVEVILDILTSMPTTQGQPPAAKP
jgi:polyisoprenoid-binding protein YceI